MKTQTWVPLILLAACQTPGGEDQISSAVLALIPEEGSAEDFERTNGRSLTGEAGPPLFGVDYAFVTLNGAPVTDVTTVHGHLLGRLSDGSTVEGTAWAGAMFRGRAADGSPVPLRIETVDSPGSDLHFYTVSRARPGHNGPEWSPLCEPDPNDDIRAMAVGARWDQNNGDRVPSSTHFTFACPTGAVAKCISFGYGPWLNGEVMEGAHQACTRAVRFDVCGKGQSNTIDGTQIHVYDRLDHPIRQNLFDRKFFEAGWTPNGAHCLSHLRWRFLEPECDLQVEPAMPQGPFVRDAEGRRLEPRICDSPEEALAAGVPMSVFTESLSLGREDLPEGPAPTP